MTFNFVQLPDPTQPPGGRGGPADPLLIEFAEALRGNPGAWAEWPKSSKNGTSLVARINNPKRQGHPAAFRGGRFEATSRAGIVYVRYLGEAQR